MSLDTPETFSSLPVEQMIAQIQPEIDVELSTANDNKLEEFDPSLDQLIKGQLLIELFNNRFSIIIAS